MKPKTMILMGLAIVCGLGASYMTSRLLADRGETEKDMVKILVAKKDLSIGTPIRKPEELFEEKQIPKEAETPDAIKDFDQLKDKVLKQSRNKGDSITAASLLGKNETLDVPDGHEAVGLRTSLETSASGLATLPGSRVNLIWFQRGDRNETSRSDYLLEDVLVLAADGKVDREGLTAVAQVVTLALTPEQVVRVNLAKETGIINLTLRKHGNHEKKYIPGIVGEDLRNEIANRNKAADSVNPEEVYKKEGPPSDGAKATFNAPLASAKAPMIQEQPKIVEPQIKTTRVEFSVFQGNRVEHIVRDIDEAGRIVNETRTITDLPVPQAAPAPQKKAQSLDISVVN